MLIRNMNPNSFVKQRQPYSASGVHALNYGWILGQSSLGEVQGRTGDLRKLSLNTRYSIKNKQVGVSALKNVEQNFIF